jgi:hypothetical protein
MAVKGETMRTISWVLAVVAAAVLAFGTSTSVLAGDYNHRFVRNYPPGYYGMWYKAERFSDTTEPGVTPTETYRWDRFMGKVTEVTFPFSPIPYDWEYGNGRSFNLPNTNRNDWWR